MYGLWLIRREVVEQVDRNHEQNQDHEDNDADDKTFDPLSGVVDFAAGAIGLESSLLRLAVSTPNIKDISHAVWICILPWTGTSTKQCEFHKGTILMSSTYFDRLTIENSQQAFHRRIEPCMLSPRPESDEILLPVYK
jgi:hypothetical protein